MSRRRAIDNRTSAFLCLVLNNDSTPVDVRVILVPSAHQHYLPVKSGIAIDENTNTVHFDASPKCNLLATGHFALEFDASQPAFVLLVSYAQEINRLTNITSFPSSSKSVEYLATTLPKSKSFTPYQWHISHDQSAVSIRQIPFTSVKQLLHILNLIHQQMYLTKYLDFYFNNEYEHDHMEEEDQDISLELSLPSPSVLSITCAQATHLATFLLQMSNRHALPVLLHRQQEKEIYLGDNKQSLLKFIPQLLKETPTPILPTSNVDLETTKKPSDSSNPATTAPKFNRRLSCGPPGRPVWRRATTLRRHQPVCLTLTSVDGTQEKIDDEQIPTEEPQPNVPLEDFDDDDEAFLQSPLQRQQSMSQHQPLLPKPSLSFHPSVLSRCGSVSSTQSVSTPPIFGLSPCTPYPGGSNNPNGNHFFPLGKQVSMPEYSPVSSPITMGSFDPLAFLPVPGNVSANAMTPADANNKGQQKKKRRRSEQSNDDFIQTMNNNPNGRKPPPQSRVCVSDQRRLDNRSPMHATKLSSSGADPNNAKRGKKPADKNAQQHLQQQLARQKSAFKVTDVPATTLLSQQSVTSPDDTTNELKPLKVVIKRVGDGGSSSNDESQQQQSMKQRKKQQQQQAMGNPASGMPSTMRKLPTNNSSGGSSPSVLIKSESLDLSQMSSDSNSSMSINDGISQSPRYEICSSYLPPLSLSRVAFPFVSANDLVHHHP